MRQEKHLRWLKMKLLSLSRKQQAEWLENACIEMVFVLRCSHVYNKTDAFEEELMEYIKGFESQICDKTNIRKGTNE